MKKFSERMGFKPVADTIQVDGMSRELRNSLWNVLDIFVWRKMKSTSSSLITTEIEGFFIGLWMYYFKDPLDSMPILIEEKLSEIRTYYFSCEWLHVYDFLEFVLSYYNTQTDLVSRLNGFLKRELSGYRIVNNKFVIITNEQEIEMLEEAFQDDQFEGATEHLRRAFELFSDRKAPDYRNSIKESISAVESMAKVITDKPSATLGEALTILERNGKLHPALKNGFSNIYGYTNDKGGIRHAMLEQPDLNADDAKFFLLSCTSFVNYLKTKMDA